MTANEENCQKIVCPHCGHSWKPSTFLLTHWTQYGIGVPEVCRECGQIYEVEIQAKWLFITTKVRVEP